MRHADAPAMLDELRDTIPDIIRIRSGRIPGTELFDVGSEDGFVAAGIARAAPDWTVYTAVEPDPRPENVELVDASLPDLPFEDDQLAAVVGAFVVQEMDAFGPELLEDVVRVLVPEGRFIIAFRAPGPRAGGVARTIPAGAIELAGKVGFESAIETTEQHLHDGSQLRLLRAVLPGS